MPFNLVPIAYAADWTDACQVDGVATIGGIECLLGNILTPLPGLIALAAVGMIIWSGIRIIGAGSDVKAYESAWKTFTYAVVGLLLLSAIWFVFIFIKGFLGVDLTNFQFQSTSP